MLHTNFCIADSKLVCDPAASAGTNGAVYAGSTPLGEIPCDERNSDPPTGSVLLPGVRGAQNLPDQGIKLQWTVDGNLQATAAEPAYTHLRTRSDEHTHTQWFDKYDNHREEGKSERNNLEWFGVTRAQEPRHENSDDTEVPKRHCRQEPEEKTTTYTNNEVNLQKENELLKQQLEEQKEIGAEKDLLYIRRLKELKETIRELEAKLAGSKPPSRQNTHSKTLADTLKESSPATAVTAQPQKSSAPKGPKTAQATSTRGATTKRAQRIPDNQMDEMWATPDYEFPKATARLIKIKGLPRMRPGDLRTLLERKTGIVRKYWGCAHYLNDLKVWALLARTDAVDKLLFGDIVHEKIGVWSPDEVLASRADFELLAEAETARPKEIFKQAHIAASLLKQGLAAGDKRKLTSVCEGMLVESVPVEVEGATPNEP
ncbi:hypothetical protein PAPHI01_2232 [Pancytospora philotis]|nr:hypothetical protein PAPHI01_2232 [Pancytospora philotis]